jgi:hypothetical protein
MTSSFARVDDRAEVVGKPDDAAGGCASLSVRAAQERVVIFRRERQVRLRARMISYASNGMTHTGHIAAFDMSGREIPHHAS